MKRHLHRSAVTHDFNVGDKVLVLLPIAGSALSARFTGPYEILECLSDTDYLLNTPDRKRKSRVCHVNMLKVYHCQDDSVNTTRPATAPQPLLLHSSAIIRDSFSDDEIAVRLPPSRARLPNSETLQSLPSLVENLMPEKQNDIFALIHRFRILFSDIPTRTTVLQHDIAVDSARTIKQHAYRINPVKRAQMKNETDYLLKHGFVRHSSSPWSSPCLAGG